MNKFILISITISITSLFWGCNKKKDIEIAKPESQPKVDFVIDEQLSTTDYVDVAGYFPKEGLVPTAEIAFKIAEPVLNKIYGTKQIENEKPFSINLENDIWIIEGSIIKGIKGGVAYMEIRKSNGEILKVIHSE